MIDTVLFDMDGVLIDSESVSLGMWSKAAAVLGVDMDFSLFKYLCGTKVSQLPASIVAKLPPQDQFEAVYTLRKQMEKDRTEPYKLMPYVDQLLAYLASQNIKAYLVTSTDQQRATARLAPYNLQNRLQGYMFGSMVENLKPEPDIYLQAMAMFNVDPKTAIVVEDSANGVVSAYRAGLTVVAVPDQYNIDELQQAGYCTIRSSLKEVIDYISQRNGQEAGGYAGN